MEVGGGRVKKKERRESGERGKMYSCPVSKQVRTEEESEEGRWVRKEVR